jgi:ADP-ribosylglycohydrolase
MICGVYAVFVLFRNATMDQDLHAMRMRRAAQSLEGLSCGDAFGERFFLSDAVAQSLIQERAVPAPPWFFTDDTVMALSILETLAEHREINPDALAISFAGRYDAGRGYGPAMHKLLPAIRRQHCSNIRPKRQRGWQFRRRRPSESHRKHR